MRQAWADTLQIDLFQCENYPCVRLSGEGEERGAHALAGVLEQLIQSGHCRLMVDTRDLRFLDQFSHDALIAVLQMLEEQDGLMVIVDQSLPVERTLKLLSIDRVIHVAPSLSQAVAYLDWHE